MLLFFLQISCYQDEARNNNQLNSSQNHEVNAGSGENKKSNSSSKDSNQKSDLIRAVDFRNFTYPWYPTGYVPPHGKRTTILQDGKIIVEKDAKKNIENVYLSLANVFYTELTGDDQEEAVVTISGVVTFNSGAGCVFIYTLRDERPKLLWKHEIGDRADGGLRSLRIENKNLVIEEYEIKFDYSEGRYEDGTGLCCAKRYVRSYYSWNGKRFRKIKSDVLANEYGDARFLGYPSDFKDKQ
jgi:hypothetical protein